jgi:flagellar hook-associated protein 3 FlgL
MTRFNSVSDLARAYQLRLSQGALKSRLDTLSRESATGVKADIPQALGGDMGRISQLESQLTLLATYKNNLAEADSLLDGMQNAAESIRSMASGSGTYLASDTLTSSDNALQAHLRKAPDQMRAALSALNVSVAGRSAFAGSASNGPAVVGYEQLMAQLTTAVGGATDAAGITAAIDAYFDGPSGSGGFSDIGYLGDDQGSIAVPISASKAVTTGLTANSPEFRMALKGFAVAAYAAGATGLDAQTVRSLSQAAGTRLVNSQIPLTAAMSRIGVQQEIVSRIQTTNAAETSTLTIARNALIEADPYETATALKEIEANIETLYTLTSRLSKLSLVGYL